MYFIKIRPAEFFHADGRTDRQTDMTKLTVAFRTFAKAPKHKTIPIRNQTDHEELQRIMVLHTH